MSEATRLRAECLTRAKGAEDLAKMHERSAGQYDLEEKKAEARGDDAAAGVWASWCVMALKLGNTYRQIADDLEALAREGAAEPGSDLDHGTVMREATLAAMRYADQEARAGNGKEQPAVDFPAAWKIARATPIEDHDHKCSYRQCSGGMLCDCNVLLAAQGDDTRVDTKTATYCNDPDCYGEPHKGVEAVAVPEEPPDPDLLKAVISSLKQSGQEIVRRNRKEAKVEASRVHD